MSNDLLKRANELLDKLLEHDLQYGAQTGAAQIVDDLITTVEASARQLQQATQPESIPADTFTVNFVRLAGLDKHKARECEAIVRQVLASAPPPPTPPSPPQTCA